MSSSSAEQQQTAHADSSRRNRRRWGRGGPDTLFPKRAKHTLHSPPKKPVKGSQLRRIAVHVCTRGCDGAPPCSPDTPFPKRAKHYPPPPPQKAVKESLLTRIAVHVRPCGCDCAQLHHQGVLPPSGLKVPQGTAVATGAVSILQGGGGRTCVSVCECVLSRG